MLPACCRGLAGCSLFVPAPIVAPATPTPAPTATVRPSPTPTLPPPTPVQTPTPQASVTQEEAQGVVRAWFDALGSEDYRKMEELTEGDAQTATLGLTDTIQSEAGQRGVQLDMVVQELQLAQGQALSPGQGVRAAFMVDARAVVGPMSFSAQLSRGAATFVVDRVNGRPRITGIQEASGLPGR